MARTGNGSTTQLLNTTVGVTAAPLTMAIWGRPANTTARHWAFTLANSSNAYFGISFAGDLGGDPVRATAVDGANAGSASSNGYSANVWQHLCGVFTSSTSRAVFRDGANKATNTTNVTPSTISRTEILYNSIQLSNANGDFAEAGLWDVALTDEEVAILADGYSPLFVRPESLIGYWPLIGNYSPEIDLVGGRDLTLSGTPAKAAHCRVIYPKHRGLKWAAAAVTNVTGTASISLSPITVAGSGAVGASGTGAVVLSTITVSGVGAEQFIGSGSVTLPTVTVSGVGAAGAVGTSAIVLSAITSAGTGLEQFIGSAAIVLNPVTVSGSGAEQFIGSGAVQLPAVTVAGTGVAGVVGTGMIILPTVTTSGAGLEEIIGSGSIVLPAVLVDGTGSHGGVVVVDTNQHFRWIGMGFLGR